GAASDVDIGASVPAVLVTMGLAFEVHEPPVVHAHAADSHGIEDVLQAVVLVVHPRDALDDQAHGHKSEIGITAVGAWGKSQGIAHALAVFQAHKLHADIDAPPPAAFDEPFLQRFVLFRRRSAATKPAAVEEHLMDTDVAKAGVGEPLAR